MYQRTVTIPLLILIAVGLFSIGYYISGKEYLAGGRYHYQGESIVSVEQLGLLASEHSIANQGDITVQQSEDSVETTVAYDFYTSEDYKFLSMLPFSYLDTPFINDVFSLTSLLIVGYIVGMVLLFLVLSKIKSTKLANAIINGAWYILHPHRLIKQSRVSPVYIPNLAESVNIEYEKAGILAYRTWKRKGNLLYSAGIGQACWGDKVLLSDKPPSDSNENGVYAMRLGAFDEGDFSGFGSRIIGLVSLTGEWREHADGVIRAESCEILHLFVSRWEKNMGSDLSSTYGVPVTVTDSTVAGYSEWIFSDNGMKCLEHNHQIIKGGKNGDKGKGHKKGQIAIKAA